MRIFYKPNLASANLRPLLLSHHYLFLQHVEIVNDDTNEEIEGEESSKNNEYHEVDVPIQ